jgi:hypothetical protein
MKTSAVLAVSFIGILLTLPAQSEEQEFLWGHPPLLATTSTIKVEVWDGVEGGCFTNKAGIKDAVELAFRRNGLKVTEEDLSDVFAINIYGRRALAADGTKLGCTVSSSANPYMRRLVTVPYSDPEGCLSILCLATTTEGVEETLMIGEVPGVAMADKTQPVAEIVCPSNAWGE